MDLVLEDAEDVKLGKKIQEVLENKNRDNGKNA